MRYFGWQLRKEVFATETIFVFLAFMICYFFTGISEVSFHNVFLSDFLRITCENVLALIFPMLVCLPLAVKYVTEWQSGYLYLMLSKMSIKRYVLTKLLTNALIGGLLVSIPAAICLIMLVIDKGLSVGSYMESSWQINLFPMLYETHPVGYACMMLLAFFLCGAVFATLGLGIGAILKKRYLAILLPLAYYIGTAVAFPGGPLNATNMYTLGHLFSNELIFCLIHEMILFIVGATLFIMGVQRNVE